jgi:general secretion pathway protein G
MLAINDALDLFKVDAGFYPVSLEALWIRPPYARRWGPEPYLREFPPKDPWGNEYQYRYDGFGRPRIVSLGADGRAGCECPDCDLDFQTMDGW